MKRMTHPLFTVLLGLASSTVFWAGCTFLIDTESLLTECVSETDCAEGFYCDEGACLPGEAPPPFITEEPNLPDFSSDGGSPGGPPPQVNMDGGMPMPASGDAGISVPAPATTDAGAMAVEPTTSDAGSSSPVINTDAGNDTDSSDDGSTTTTDAGDSSNDASTHHGDAGTVQDSPVAISDAGVSDDTSPTATDAGQADETATTDNAQSDGGAN